MENLISQMTPIFVEAIKTGTNLAWWYAFLIYGLPFVKSLINTVIILVVVKWVIDLIKYLFIEDRKK